MVIFIHELIIVYIYILDQVLKRTAIKQLIYHKSNTNDQMVDIKFFIELPTNNYIDVLIEYLNNNLFANYILQATPYDQQHFNKKIWSKWTHQLIWNEWFENKIKIFVYFEKSIKKIDVIDVFLIMILYLYCINK